jgi:hypothetical protein
VHLLLQVSEKLAENFRDSGFENQGKLGLTLQLSLKGQALFSYLRSEIFKVS